MVKKGSIVEVQATAHTSYDDLAARSIYDLVYKPKGCANRETVKCLFKIKTTPWTGLVIGYSYLATGVLCEDGPPSMVYDPYGRHVLQEDKRHRVYLVVPSDTDRYIKPERVLEEDFVVVVSPLSKALSHLREALARNS